MGAEDFTDLTDTPSQLGTAGQRVVVNSDADGLIFEDIPAASGADDFTDLGDTPSSLGTAGQVVQVNSGATGLEFGSKQETEINAVKTTLNLSLADYTTDVTETRLAIADLAGDHAAQGITVSGNRLTFANAGEYRFQASVATRVAGGVAGGDRTIVDFFAKIDGTEDSTTRQSLYHRGNRTGITDIYETKLVLDLILEAGDIVDFFAYPDFESAASTLSISSSAMQIVSGEIIPIGSRTAGATTFEALTDTPASLTGQAGKILEVNTDADALVFADKPASATSFEALTDTPNTLSGNAGKVVEVNAGANGLVFGNKPDSGVTTFQALTDTPGAFTGQAGKVVAVNTDADALTFEDSPPPADNSISPPKLDAGTTAKQDAFLDRLGAASQRELFSRSAAITVPETTPYPIGTVLYGTGITLGDDPDATISVEGHDTGLDLGKYDFKRSDLTTQIIGGFYSGAPRMPIQTHPTCLLYTSPSPRD